MCVNLNWAALGTTSSTHFFFSVFVEFASREKSMSIRDVIFLFCLHPKLHTQYRYTFKINDYNERNTRTAPRCRQSAAEGYNEKKNLIYYNLKGTNWAHPTHLRRAVVVVALVVIICIQRIYTRKMIRCSIFAWFFHCTLMLHSSVDGE